MNFNKLNIFSILFIFILIFVDFIALVFSFEISIFIRSFIFDGHLSEFHDKTVDKYYWIIFLSIFMFIYEKIYFIRFDFWGDSKRVINSLFITFIVTMTVISLTKFSLDYSRGFLIIYFFVSIVIVLFFKRWMKRFLFRFDIFKVKVSIVGKEKQYDKIKEEVNKNWYFGYKINKKNYDIVLISSKYFSVDELQKMIKKYSKKTKDIYVIPFMDHLDFTHTSIVDYSNIRLSAIHIENRLLNFKNTFIKNIFEKTLVLIASPFIILVHFILLIFIKLDSRGPVLFKQKRFGKDAKSFSCYKYRTMYIENDKVLEKYLKENPDEIEYYEKYHKYKNDPRITKFGKFLRKTSLDEFPQFYNILRGDMNLIGPRPYMLSEQEKIGKIHEEVILEVKPGITGLWQVSGRNKLTFKERIELDKWYIQNWSLWMDFVIFLKTIKVVLSKVGAK